MGWRTCDWREGETEEERRECGQDRQESHIQSSLFATQPVRHPVLFHSRSLIHPLLSLPGHCSGQKRVQTRQRALGVTSTPASMASFEASLVRLIEERNAVEVLWDGGMKTVFKWSSLVWGTTRNVWTLSVPAPPVEDIYFPSLMLVSVGLIFRPSSLARVMTGSGPTIFRMQIPGYTSSSRSPHYTGSQPYAPAPLPTTKCTDPLVRQTTSTFLVCLRRRIPVTLAYGQGS